jgi:hypothetical protein
MQLPPTTDEKIDNLVLNLKKEIDARKTSNIQLSDTLKMEIENRTYERDGYRKAIAQLEQRIITLEKKNK